MGTTDLLTWAGCPAIAMGVAAGLKQGLEAAHKRYERDVGGLSGTADFLWYCVSSLLSAIAGTLVGFAYGHLSDTMGNDGFVGAMWGFAGALNVGFFWKDIVGAAKGWLRRVSGRREKPDESRRQEFKTTTRYGSEEQ